MANNIPFLSITLFSTKSQEGDVNSSPFDEGMGRGTNNDKYHLIWSPNFWKKMILSMAGWWALQYALTKISSISAQGMACHAPNTKGWQSVLSSSVVLPLLSSSCCAIQLIINALSGWGCAGFNTFLGKGSVLSCAWCSNPCVSGILLKYISIPLALTGPIRPVLLSLLLMSTWKLHFTGTRSIGWTIASLLLAFLPELLDIWNTNRSHQWQRDSRPTSRNRDEKESVALSPSLPFEAKVRLTIPTMGCVACVNKVDSSIRRCVSAANNNIIREEKSWLSDDPAKGGVAELTLFGKTREEIDGVVEEVIAAVHDAGFVCKVASLQVREK